MDWAFLQGNLGESVGDKTKNLGNQSGHGVIECDLKCADHNSLCQVALSARGVP